jgi:hypothetical protein
MAIYVESVIEYNDGNSIRRLRRTCGSISLPCVGSSYFFLATTVTAQKLTNSRNDLFPQRRKLLAHKRALGCRECTNEPSPLKVSQSMRVAEPQRRGKPHGIVSLDLSQLRKCARRAGFVGTRLQSVITRGQS